MTRLLFNEVCELEHQNITIIAPSCFHKEKWSEAEVLGGMVFLWSKHSYYRQISVESMLEVLLPMIKSKQFAFFSRNHVPIGYLCWAFMNEETEQDYLENNGFIERFVGCNNGEQMWFLSLFAPGGESKLIYQLAKNILFPTTIAKSLYHRGREKGLRILHSYGSDVVRN